MSYRLGRIGILHNDDLYLILQAGQVLVEVLGKGRRLEGLPKGIDLGAVTQAQLTAIEIRLNTRPRRILDFQTPDEVFSNLQLNEFLSVALQV